MQLWKIKFSISFMKRLIFLVILFSGCAVFTPLKKSRLISVFHLIETNKFEDAKGLVEEMIEDEEASQWPRTWYARGLLSQTAYREGMQRNNRKLFELYPDQLFVAIESYEKARELDTRGRLERQLAPRYILLANDFQKLGEKHFSENKYKEALRAFEQALEITQSPLLAVKTDTNLIYNTALAAYEARKWEKSIKYFNILHDYRHSVNATHLLFTSYLEKGDTIAAELVLSEGVNNFNFHEDLVLLLADLLFITDDKEGAIEILQEAATEHPENHLFPFTKGLIYQKSSMYENAIESYKKAIELNPEELRAYLNIATCYYNIGVQIDESARTITMISLVQEERARSAEAFDSAVKWLDKVFEKEPDDQEILSQLYQLYKTLRVNDRLQSIEDQRN